LELFCLPDYSIFEKTGWFNPPKRRTLDPANDNPFVKRFASISIIGIIEKPSNQFMKDSTLHFYFVGVLVTTTLATQLFSSATGKDPPVTIGGE